MGVSCFEHNEIYKEQACIGLRCSFNEQWEVALGRMGFSSALPGEPAAIANLGTLESQQNFWYFSRPDRARRSPRGGGGGGLEGIASMQWVVVVPPYRVLQGGGAFGRVGHSAVRTDRRRWEKKGQCKA